MEVQRKEKRVGAKENQRKFDGQSLVLIPRDGNLGRAEVLACFSIFHS